MATNVETLDKPLQVTVLSGDTLIIKCPTRRNTNEQARLATLAVTPAGSASVGVFISLTPWEIIYKNPDDPNINWKSWPLGTVTSANSPTAYDSFEGIFSALKISTTGGNCVVEGAA